jgi:hypothetical protein
MNDLPGLGTFGWLDAPVTQAVGNVPVSGGLAGYGDSLGYSTLIRSSYSRPRLAQRP